jgi:flagellar biosynthesis/type III secretory pathway M-ring protein FliF/YscJ
MRLSWRHWHNKTDLPLLFGFALILSVLTCASAYAGSQQYEPLADSVRAALHAAISDRAAPEPQFPSIEEKINWPNAQALIRNWCSA